MSQPLLKKRALVLESYEDAIKAARQRGSMHDAPTRAKHFSLRSTLFDFNANVGIDPAINALVAKATAQPCSVEIIVEEAGTTNIAHNIHLDDPNLRIGVMIAGNSGRPGGACGLFDGNDKCGVHKVREGHKTQEEDILSNWFMTTKNNAHVGYEELYAATICGQWGMREPLGSGVDTLQGVDYTAAMPRDYADAWVVNGAELSVKQLGDTIRYDYAKSFPCTLVFAAGPNAKPPGWSRPDSTMRRTFNSRAHADYADFLSSVTWAVYTSLVALARDGCQVAMVARLSCGLYSRPNHEEAINRDFPGMVNALLLTGGPSGQPPLGRFFKRVVIVMDKDPNSK